MHQGLSGPFRKFFNFDWLEGFCGAGFGGGGVGLTPAIAADGTAMALANNGRIWLVQNLGRHIGCGDGIVQDDEECDNGVCDGDCTPECTQAVCGDGYVNLTGFRARTGPAESCDDGNQVDGDGCSAECQSELIMGGGGKRSECLLEWRADPVPPRDKKGRPVSKLECVDDDPSCDHGATAGDRACTFRLQMCFNERDPRLFGRSESFSQSPFPIGFGFACERIPLEWFQLKSPNAMRPRDATDTANRDAIEAQMTSLGWTIVGRCANPVELRGELCESDDDCEGGKCAGRELWRASLSAVNECTSFFEVRVPLGETGGVSVKGKRVIKAAVSGADPDSEFDRQLRDTDTLKLTCLPQ